MMLNFFHNFFLLNLDLCVSLAGDSDGFSCIKESLKIMSLI